jgi:hypothetical protein
MTVRLDHRIREELQQAADSIQPDVERNLGAVEARARRGNGMSASILVVAAVSLLVVVSIRLGAAPHEGPGPGGSVLPSPIASSAAPSMSSSPSYPQVAGTYVVTLDPSDAAVARDGVAGLWTLRLQADGVALLSAPQAFQPGASGLSGITYGLVGDRLRTDLFYNDFCHSIGTYTWSLAQGGLRLTPVDETCSIRRTLLSTAPWSVAP